MRSTVHVSQRRHSARHSATGADTHFEYTLTEGITIYTPTRTTAIHVNARRPPQAENETDARMGPCETAGRDVGLVTQLQRAGDTLRAVQAATARGHSGRPLVCIQKSIRASEEVSQALEVCLRPRPCSHEVLLLRVESRERCRVATARIDELGALRAASRAQRIQTQSACGIQVGMWSALGAGSATGQHRDSHPQRFRKVMPEMREWRVRQGHVRVDPFVQQDRHTAQLERIIQPERLD